MERHGRIFRGSAHPYPVTRWKSAKAIFLDPATLSPDNA
jgi:hypothetical protein